MPASVCIIWVLALYMGSAEALLVFREIAAITRIVWAQGRAILTRPNPTGLLALGMVTLAVGSL